MNLTRFFFDTVFRTSILAALVCLVGCSGAPVEPPPLTPKRRPNVLMICVDDLRPELGCFGAAHVQTPNLDKLARSAVMFDRHFVQVPTCGASRASMLTGRYPRHRRSLSNNAFDSLAYTGRPNLPGWFRAHGYQTMSIGKVTHSPDGRHRNTPGKGDGTPELAGAWDEVGAPSGIWGDAWGAFFGYADGSSRERGVSPAFEPWPGDPMDTADGRIASAAVDRLQSMTPDKPFFLAVGFYRPHLPHNAPAKWMEQYPLDSVPEPRDPDATQDVDPVVPRANSGELLRNYGGHPAGGLADAEYLQRLRRAYFASVSHVDEQIGRVLDKLRDTGLDANTIVIVWSDHGYHLGELGLWGKHTLHDIALRSPLILRIPGMPTGRCSNCIESVDLYPTLLDFCDLPPVDGLDGANLRPMLEYPGRMLDREARSFWQRGGLLGRTLRNGRWRLTEWRRGEEIVAVELYDHVLDPGETLNRAATSHAKVVELTRQLGAPGF